MERAYHMAIDRRVLDQLPAGRDPQEPFAKEGLLDELKKALSERMLTAELDDHFEKERAEVSGNRRDGPSRTKTETGPCRWRRPVTRSSTWLGRTMSMGGWGFGAGSPICLLRPRSGAAPLDLVPLYPVPLDLGAAERMATFFCSMWKSNDPCPPSGPTPEAPIPEALVPEA